jgi:hypothetical protein
MYVDVQTYNKKILDRTRQFKLTDLEKIKFIHMDEKELKATKNLKTEDEDKIEALYENEAVKSYIYHCTAPYCYDCDKEFRSYGEYK